MTGRGQQVEFEGIKTFSPKLRVVIHVEKTLHQTVIEMEVSNAMLSERIEGAYRSTRITVSLARPPLATRLGLQCTLPPLLPEVLSD